MIKTLLPLKSLLPFVLSVFCTLTYAQTGIVNGTIFDDKHQTAIGATVKVKGTGIGAATDINGKFTIPNAPVGDQTLVISSIGFQPQEVAVTVKESIINTVPDITLKTDALLLNDVVVVGYGTQVKRDMSSSVITVKAEDLEDKPVYDFTSAMAGEAAGVQVTTDNGLAGATTTVRVRGVKTLSNDAEPLYVIDGVPIVSIDISNANNYSYNISPLSTIDPSEIASVVILKDAEATAIYGARGANGVIIVTTKQGKSGKTKVDISSSAGITQAGHEISLLNTQQYVSLYEKASVLDGTGAGRPLPDGIPFDSIAHTNWLNQVLRTGYFTDNNVSASGGDGKTTFYVNGGLRDDKGFIIGNAFKRGSFRLNIDHTVNKYLSFGANTSTTYTHNEYVPTSATGGLGGAQSYALPIYPVYAPGGGYFFMPNPSAQGSSANYNPVAEVELTEGQNNTFRNISNAYLNFNPIPELTFRNEFGVDIINQLENFYNPEVLTGTSANAADRRDFYLTWNYISTVDYKKEINPNNTIDAQIGLNPTETTEQFSYIAGKGFSLPSQTQVQNSNPDSISGTAGTGRQYSFASFFSRLNYKLFNRFLFEASFRADGSSRFGPTNKYGYFPAGSFGWIMTDEKFLKHQKALTFLKFRASAGTTGNAQFTDDWPYLSAFGNSQYGGLSGVSPSALADLNLRWETTIKTNVGFDFGFLNNRLSGALDLYDELTNHVLVQGAPLTPSGGYGSTNENLGDLYNRGIELNLTSNNFKPTSPIQWKTTLNIATNQNKVTNLGGVAEVTGTNFGNNAAVVGEPVGVWLLAQYEGINPQTGQMMIDSFGHKVAANATNTVSLEKPVGNPYPKFQGGFDNNFTFKNFTLDVLLTFSVGQQIYDDDGKRQDGDMYYQWNQLTDVLNAWERPGQISNLPKITDQQTTATDYDINTTRYLYDASFLKLKNITLGYNFPSRIVAKMKMRSLRVYISGQNLAFYTKYPGWDPETNRNSSGAITQGVSYLNSPQARIFSLGINIGF